VTRLTSRSCSALVLLWSCIALFGARVIGQLETRLLAPQWLPDMDAWYSGLLPYPLLLPAQIALLMIMSAVAWNRRIRTGCFARANPRVAGALRLFALLYFTAMAVRLAVNINVNGVDYWSEGAIPVAFHWVLALFLLVSARAAGESMPGLRVPADEQHEDDETCDVAHGDVPPVPQPLTYGLGLGEQVGNRHPG
jgi:hypothetical protein